MHCDTGVWGLRMADFLIQYLLDVLSADVLGKRKYNPPVSHYMLTSNRSIVIISYFFGQEADLEDDQTLSLPSSYIIDGLLLNLLVGLNAS